MYTSQEHDNEPIPFHLLRERQQTLEQRLEDGFRRIEEAERQGRDIKSWETFWFQLLSEYESVCDALMTAA